MGKGFFNVPIAVNEPVKSYAPESPERDAVLKTYKAMFNSKIDVPLYINGEAVKTGNTRTMSPPHDHQHIVGTYHVAEQSHIDDAISTALEARKTWSRLPWEQRAGIFLKAAELIAGPYRAKINAATMMAQSKTIHQAEIDAACEFIDFLRFNVQFMTDIYAEQPESTSDAWNRIEYRPLEGFTYAVTPFNFTAIAGNLPACMALMGNVVVWKPSDSQVYSAKVIMDVFEEAGVPLSGLHFTGSTFIFKELWKQIGNHIHNYKTYPRIVGETGGKDFIVAHKSANPKQVATAIVRGAFEFQGQKCSAASRAYIPKSLWAAVKKFVIEDVNSFKMGSPEDMSNFITAVIHEASFDKLASYIDGAKSDTDADIIVGGNYDKSKGYFIEPTVIVTKDPKYTTFYINDKPTGAVVGQQPFGGARASGTNDKAGSAQNLLRWVSPRLIKETFVTPTDYRYPFLGE